MQVTEQTRSAPGPGEGALDRTKLGVVDCDVHPTLTGLAELLPYLSSSWRRRLDWIENYPKIPFHLAYFPGRRMRPNVPVLREDMTPENGGPPASDPAHVARTWLDRHNVHRALLFSLDATILGVWQDADEAAALASAFNDLLAERWLSADARFRLVMMVSLRDMDKAVAEVRRLAGRPQIAAVGFAPNEMGLGSRFYFPLYQACEEANLPITLHPTVWDSSYTGVPAYAVHKDPTTYAEQYAILPEMPMSFVGNLVFEGVFERFPTLRFCFSEYGWTWLATFLWKMDTAWKETRVAIPWLRRPPSEQARERIRFTTQPGLDDPPSERFLANLLEMLHDGEMLVYSSDYPHWDLDDPQLAFKNQPADFVRRVFRENALDFFGERMRG
jgi:uncharacterized protein